MSIDTQDLLGRFAAQFDGPAQGAARAPGRVNIIGEHTDYNHGFVLPMAIGRETAIAFRPREDHTLRAVAANFENDAVELSLDTPRRDPDHPWVDYLAGVVYELAKAGKPVRGADALILGDVPIGSGLSSSASIEMAALVMFEHLGGFQIEGPEAAKLGQRVENGFLGLSSGIMDQFIIRMGRKDHALFLDCRSHVFEMIPVAFADACFVVADTGVTRGLTASKYNERVAECQAAVDALRETHGGEGSHLRDYTLEQLEAARHAMAGPVYQRARHVVMEDVRTRDACAALKQGDPVGLGVLMDASHASLRDDYAVSCPELDAMTEIARALPGCYGSRMTGAGFGGCAVHLVAASQAEAFGNALLQKYEAATQTSGAFLVTSPADGARVEKV